MSKIINIFGGPGSGKSTTAAGVFSLLKLHGVNCELVTEYAKDLTWDESFEVLRNQEKVTAEQYYRVWRLLGKVDYVITDSPILQRAAYTDISPIQDHIRDLFEEFYNINYFLRRVKPYQEIGRNQTEDEAKELDNEITELLELYRYTGLEGNWSAINKIVGDILESEGWMGLEYGIHWDICGG